MSSNCRVSNDGMRWHPASPACPPEAPDTIRTEIGETGNGFAAQPVTRAILRTLALSLLRINIFVPEIISVFTHNQIRIGLSRQTHGRLSERADKNRLKLIE